MQLINIVSMKRIIIKVILWIWALVMVLILLVFVLIGIYAFVYWNQKRQDGSIYLNDNWELLTGENAKKSCAAAQIIRMPTTTDGDLPLVLARYGMCEADGLLVFYASDEWIESIVHKYNMTPKAGNLTSENILGRINGYKKLGLPQLDDLIASGTWESYHDVHISHANSDAQRLVTLSMMVDRKQHIVICKFLFQ